MIDLDEIFNIKTPEEFNNFALRIFDFQFKNNSVYRSFCDLILRHPSDISSYRDIPFLPIQFFKSHRVVSSKIRPAKTFLSSGTTQENRSKHYITDLNLYEQSFQATFKRMYGNIQNYVILALLPSYLQQENSSLIYMVDNLIKATSHEASGFYLNNLGELNDTILQLEANNQKVLLIGVSYALLDLVETYQFKLKNTIIMETGGMKGRRKELIRSELHDILGRGFGVEKIHSEYGMTELLSQAYSDGSGIFYCPPWMKALSRSVQDPFSIYRSDKTGGINIIDLANINSCSFIATQDLGKVYSDDSFEILGRFDSADIRGCNLMVI